MTPATSASVRRFPSTAMASAAKSVASKSVSTAAAKKAAPSKAVTKTTSKSVPAKKATAPKTTLTKKVAPTKAAATKSVTKAAPKKAATATATAVKAPAKSSAAKTAAPKTAAKAAAPKPAVTKAAAAAKTAAPAVATAPATKTAATKAPAVAKTSGGGVPKRKPGPGPYATDAKFLDEIRLLLDTERATYQEQATVLKAEADSLAQEREPGDVQFDEESGEGGTVTVDRERDLALSAQASLAVEEIDDAFGRVKDKSYGACERCQQPIPKARLRALPYARLCVACKSGGLSRR
jgi:RNA polymerase-binding transcription factor DksA